MSRTLRAALAFGAGLAVLAGNVSAAHAAPTAPRAAVPTPSVVKLQVEHSGKCLTVAGGSLANGANAVQTTCTDGADNQSFQLIPAGNATFMVRAMHSGKCLEVENSGTGAGANVQQWWCVDGPQQRWRLVMVDAPKKLYELRPTHTDNRCLDIAGSSLNDGANAGQWYCNGDANQRWRLKPAKA
ncbi:RICIN domain-containing protein [Streptomyces sp. WZ-12]|uniref:RICIN domain-containing protein n=1 Tax=Streptomyces sp. WZ-12 TaxID=3030210 RepID=UPI002380F455|nr:RICIN domain-containing protein [Streptomyces sp. WZ-12]